jgi:hypothetical protein
MRQTREHGNQHAYDVVMRTQQSACGDICESRYGLIRTNANSNQHAVTYANQDHYEPIAQKASTATRALVAAATQRYYNLRYDYTLASDRGKVGTE